MIERGGKVRVALELRPVEVYARSGARGRLVWVGLLRWGGAWDVGQRRANVAGSEGRDGGELGDGERVVEAIER